MYLPGRGRERERDGGGLLIANGGGRGGGTHNTSSTRGGSTVSNVSNTRHVNYIYCALGV